MTSRQISSQQERIIFGWSPIPLPARKISYRIRDSSYFTNFSLMTMKKIRSASFIVFFLLAALSGFASAQSDNRGTDFWVCFPQNAKNEFNAGLAFKLFITGDQDTKGTVSGAGIDPKHFEFKAGEVAAIDIDTSVQIIGSDFVQNLGIHVMTDKPVAVYGLSNRKASTDTYVAYPTNVLGTAYRAMCYNALAGTEDAFTSQITCIATDNNTDVRINSTANTKGGRHTGEEFTIKLQRGEVYQMSGTTQGGG